MPLAFGWERSAAVSGPNYQTNTCASEAEAGREGGGGGFFPNGRAPCCAYRCQCCPSGNVCHPKARSTTNPQTSATNSWLLGPVTRPCVHTKPSHFHTHPPHLLVTEPQGVAASTRRRRLDRPGREGGEGDGGETLRYHLSCPLNNWKGSMCAAGRSMCVCVEG